MGFQELLGVNPFDAAFTLLNTIVLFLVLKKFLFKPVENVMEQRQAEVDSIYGEAETAKAEGCIQRKACPCKRRGCGHYQGCSGESGPTR